MVTILETAFGSHLYGTATPVSDRDYMKVVILDVADILLQRVRETRRESTKKDTSVKNGPDDVETQIWALHFFMRQVAEGQIMSLDVLFSPESAWVEEPHSFWQAIVTLRPAFLSRTVTPMLAYCKKQCGTYGMKGTRVAALREVLKVLEGLIPAGHANDKLLVHEKVIRDGLAGVEGVEIGDKPAGAGPVTMLTVAQKSVPFTNTIGRAIPVFRKQLDAYGVRAFAAETNQGVDWKAVSHAKRVGEQAMELLTTGHITFPRPNASELVAIKLGKVPYREVAADLEGLLEGVVRAAETSDLPPEPDRVIMARLVAGAYRRAVVDADPSVLHDRIARSFGASLAAAKGRD
jgi:hypothetical protein